MKTEDLSRFDNLVEVLMRNAELSRGITFIRSSQEESRVTYSELLQRARGCAAWFARSGVKPGDEIVIQTGDNEFFLVAFWACLIYGSPAVPVSVAANKEAALKLLNIWNSLLRPFLVSDRQSFATLQSLVDTSRVVIRDPSDYLLLQDQIATDETVTAAYFQPRKGSDLAHIQFSSGSTGEPKGVILTHANLLANTGDISKRASITSDDKLLSWLPLTHDMGLIAVHLTAVMSNADQVIIDTALFVRRPTIWMQKASEHRATILFSPNFGFYFLTAHLAGQTFSWDLASVKLIFNGAEPISVKVCRDFVNALAKYGLRGNAIYAGYGLAEGSVAVTLPIPGYLFPVRKLQRSTLMPGDRIVESDNGLEFPGVGFQLDKCRIRITVDNVVVGDSTVGNIEITGDNVTSGYYRNEAATASLFSRDGWLKTGDLGFTRDGVLFITGRKKNIIILNGQNYYPHDLERICEDVPGAGPGKVAACSVRSVDNHGESVAIFIASTCNEDGFGTLADEIKKRLTDAIGIVVDYIIPVRRIPKTTSGKIQHHLLSKRFSSGEFDKFIKSSHDVAVLHESAATKEIIVELAAGIIGPAFDPQIEFLKQGISSLQIVRLTLQIQKTFGVSVSPADLFTCSSVDNLAQRIDSYKKEEVISGGGEYVTTGLSPGQRRLWLWEQLYPASSHLLLSSAQEIYGKLDINAFRSAFLTVLQRHDIIRSKIYSIEGEPRFERIGTLDANQWLVIEDVGQDEVDATIIKTLIDSRIELPMSLERGPLLRLHLIKLRQDRYLLLLVAHHIVFDGWSFVNFSTELTLLYRHQTSPERFPLSLPQADYKLITAIRNDEATLRSNHISKQYWLKQLTDLPSPVTTFFSRPATASSEIQRFDDINLDIGHNVLRAIRNLATQRDVSVFMIIVSALKVLLYKFTAQKDIAVFTTAFGRDRYQQQNLLGYFIRTIMLRTSISGGLLFHEVLDRVKEKIIDGFRHWEYTLEESLETMRAQGEETLNDRDLYDILVLYQNFEYDFRLDSFGEEIRVEPIETRANPLVKLQFEFTEASDHIRLRMSYDARLFDRHVVDLLSQTLLNVIESVVKDPGSTVDGLSVLSSQARERLLDLSNIGPHSMRVHETVVEMFERQVNISPDAVAIYAEGKAVSYRELNSRANRLANLLVDDLKVAPGMNIGVLVKRNEYQIASVLGVLKARAVFVPLDIEYPTVKLHSILEDCSASLVISDQDTIDETKFTFTGIVLWNDIALDSSLKSDDDIVIKPAGDDRAYIMYTSGTTGKPKGVSVRHSSLANYVAAFVKYFSLDGKDRVIQQSSMAFDTYHEEVFPALAVGAAIILVREGGRDIDGLHRSIMDYGATVLSTTPSVLYHFNNLYKSRSPLRLVISGGESLITERVGNLLGSCEVYNTYGPTECTVCATYHKVDAVDERNFIGRPLDGTHVVVMSDSELAPLGVRGEICIGGAGVAEGYLNSPELTKLKFVSTDLFDGLMYRTGDMGRWSEQGELEYLGRIDDQIKIRGYRVELGEIESALIESGLVGDCAVAAITSSGGDQMLIAYYVALNTKLDVVKSYLKARLQNYMIPVRWIQVPFIPQTSSGKIDRRTLAAKFYVEESQEIQSPSTEEERKMVDIWSSVLKKTISVDTSLFSQGGDSIAVMKIVSKARAAGFAISPRDIFRHETVSSLCRNMLSSEEPRRTDSYSGYEVLDEAEGEDVIKI